MPLFPQHEKHTRPANADRVYVLLVVLPPQPMTNKMFWITIPSESAAQLKIADRIWWHWSTKCFCQNIIRGYPHFTKQKSFFQLLMPIFAKQLHCFLGKFNHSLILSLGGAFINTALWRIGQSRIDQYGKISQSTLLHIIPTTSPRRHSVIISI